MTKNYTYIQLTKAINKLIKDNRSAKTQAERTAVISNNDDLLMDILDNANSVDDATNNGSNPDNRYVKLMNELNIWITQGSTDNHKRKNYKAKLKNENPSEIKDNESTNARIYRGASNYYESRGLRPTDHELKNNKYIQQIYNSLNELESKKSGNRFLISKAIRETKNDLNEAISNYRGINEFNRTDNILTPSPELELPSLNNKEYKSFLLTTNLEEIRRENVRLDKITMDHESNDPVIKDLGRGFTQADTAKRNGISQSTVHRRLMAMINTPVTE